MRPIAEIKHCGSTITKSTTLTKDVVGCPGVGLRIGADDITLDLNRTRVTSNIITHARGDGIVAFEPSTMLSATA